MHGANDGARRAVAATIAGASTTTYRYAESKQRRGLHENKVDSMRNDATIRPTVRPTPWRSKQAAEQIVRAASIGAWFRHAQLELREIARTFSASTTTSSMLANTAGQKNPRRSPTRVGGLARFARRPRRGRTGERLTSVQWRVPARRPRGRRPTWSRWCTPATHRRAAGSLRPATRRRRSCVRPAARPPRRPASAA